MRVILLALSKAPFPTPRSDTVLSLFEFDRFVGDLRANGFTVETSNRWPDAVPGEYWLFFHADPATRSVADEIGARYGRAACASTVVFNQLYPRGFATVNAGIAMSVGMEAYGDWLRGAVPAPGEDSFVITGAARAAARALRVTRTQGDAAMLAGGTPLPQLLWRCLSD